MKRFLESRVVLIVALVYTLALLALSLMKVGFLPKTDIPNADKLFHLCAYLGLTLIWHFYYFGIRKTRGRRPNLWICGLTIIFGIFIEVLQGVTTNYRSLDGYDILANATGVVLAFILLTLMNPPRKVKPR